MKKLLQRLFAKKPDPIRVQLVSSTTLTLEQWRKDESLVQSAKELERNSTYQMALAVLQNSHPRRIVFSSLGINPNDRIVHQAKIEGYELCLNNLAALSSQFKLTQRLEATFEAPK